MLKGSPQPPKEIQEQEAEPQGVRLEGDPEAEQKAAEEPAPSLQGQHAAGEESDQDRIGLAEGEGVADGKGWGEHDDRRLPWSRPRAEPRERQNGDGQRSHQDQGPKRLGRGRGQRRQGKEPERVRGRMRDERAKAFEARSAHRPGERVAIVEGAHVATAGEDPGRSQIVREIALRGISPGPGQDRELSRRKDDGGRKPPSMTQVRTRSQPESNRNGPRCGWRGSPVRRTSASRPRSEVRGGTM